jgi:hypothetical protein
MNLNRFSLCNLVLAGSILSGCGNSPSTASSGTSMSGTMGSVSGSSSGAGQTAGVTAPSGGSSGVGASGSVAPSGTQGGSGTVVMSGSSGTGSGTQAGSGTQSASGSGSSSGASSGTVANSGSTSPPPPTDGGLNGVPMFGPQPGVTPKAGQCIYAPVPSERKAPMFTLPAPANPAGLILRLMNNCPLDLWVSGNNLPAVELKPRVAGMPPAEVVKDWPGGAAGRITAYLDSANGFNVNFMEFNAAKGDALNADLSNVDWVGLPVEIRGSGGTPCSMGCYQPYAYMMDACPTQLLDKTHNICQAPKNWCAIGNNYTDPLCQTIVTAAKAVVANDPKCAGGAADVGDMNAANIYGCGGDFWNNSPYCCAEVTRGYKTDVNDPGKDPTQNCNYYKEMPYSTYSAYSQGICPFIYSFAYDDFNAQSGFAGCNGALEMDITYCPGDP